MGKGWLLGAHRVHPGTSRYYLLDASLCAHLYIPPPRQGFVYKCLIREYDQLSAGCQKELGRAVHMAFFAWQPDGIITRCGGRGGDHHQVWRGGEHQHPSRSHQLPPVIKLY